MRSYVLLMVFLVSSTFVNGQGSSTKAITGATLFDGANQTPLKESVIIIGGDRIKQVGRAKEIKIPNGAQVIEARGKFVIPGLADMHNHLDSDSIGITQHTEGFDTSLRRMLGWGFTLIFDPASRDLALFPELKRKSLTDTAFYPHYYAIGRTFGAKGGHGPASKYTPETVEEARAAVRDLKATKTDGVKIYYTDLIYVTTARRPMLKPEVMAAIIDEAHKQGLKVYVHSPVLKYAKEVLRAGADGLAHGILSDLIDDEFVVLMKKNRAVYVSTNAVFESVADITGWTRRAAASDGRGVIEKAIYDIGTSPELKRRWETKWNNIAYMRQRLPLLKANLRRVQAEGIPIVLGSDSAGAFAGLASQIELNLLVEAGLTPQQAIQSATINAARMVGREKDLGSIEPGKFADLLILNADPLKDIRNIQKIHRIMKSGVVYDPVQLLRKTR